MKVNTFLKYLSQPRLNKFIHHFPSDYNKALLLYRSNVRLSQAFYPLLSILEVSVRNALDIQLSAHFHDPEWLLHQTAGTFNDPELGRSRYPYRLRNAIQKVHRHLGAEYTPGKLIAELTFGIWTDFFDRTHYRLLAGEPIKIFPRLPKTVKRANIYDRLNSIRYFRNRIYHYEPICFKNGSFDLSETKKVYTEIKELLSWFDADLLKYVEDIDYIEYEIERTNNLALRRNIFYGVSLLLLKARFVLRKIYLSITGEDIF